MPADKAQAGFRQQECPAFFYMPANYPVERVITIVIKRRQSVYGNVMAGQGSNLQSLQIQNKNLLDWLEKLGHSSRLSRKHPGSNAVKRFGHTDIV